MGQEVPLHSSRRIIYGGLVELADTADSKSVALTRRMGSSPISTTIMADEIGLIEGVHYGLIYDKCLTELNPEEDDGTTLTGIWFCPLADDTAHYISKKYHLYM